MATTSIDFSKVIQYSKSNCVTESKAQCATYVKKAFEAGGCKYVSGNGWSNQNWCNTNGFKCIGDFIPEDRNPRPHKGKSIQFPSGYVQQTGDVCLIKHGEYGHICYATGPGINDWVSDYWQKPPGQCSGTGPYCYPGDVEHVQFWRHSSVMNGAPVVEQLPYTPNPGESDSKPTPPVLTNSASEVAAAKTITDINGGAIIGNNPGTVIGTHVRQI